MRKTLLVTKGVRRSAFPALLPQRDSSQGHNGAAKLSSCSFSTPGSQVCPDPWGLSSAGLSYPTSGPHPSHVPSRA